MSGNNRLHMSTKLTICLSLKFKLSSKTPIVDQSIQKNIWLPLPTNIWPRVRIVVVPPPSCPHHHYHKPPGQLRNTPDILEQIKLGCIPSTGLQPPVIRDKLTKCDI